MFQGKIIIYLKGFSFYLLFKFFSIIKGKDHVLKEISNNISSSIREALSDEYFVGKSYMELVYSINIMFCALTVNFFFLKEGAEEIRDMVFKNLNRKLKWMAGQ